VHRILSRDVETQCWRHFGWHSTTAAASQMDRLLVTRVVECTYRKRLPMFQTDLASICSRAKCAPILSCDVETQCWRRFGLAFHNGCGFTNGSTLVTRVVECTYRKRLPMFRTDLVLICSRAKCAPILSCDVETQCWRRFGLAFHNSCGFTNGSTLVTRVIECTYRKHLRMFPTDLVSICSRAKCAPILSHDVETQCWRHFWLPFHRYSSHCDCNFTTVN
jgi:predicted GNAT superfamily acetyltransferase